MKATATSGPCGGRARVSRCLVPLLLAVVFASSSPAAPAPQGATSPAAPKLNSGGDAQTLKLSLRECLEKALAANPEVAVEALNVDVNGRSVSLAREKFLPALNLNFFNQDQTTLGTWGAEGTNYRYKYNYYVLNLSQKIPTGGTFSLAFTNSMTDTGRSYTVINPAYFSQVQLNFSQPLLRGFGSTASRLEERRAGTQLEISRAAYKTKLIETAFEVESAYWGLVDSLEYLRVMESTLRESRELLARTREAARIGAKSEIEVLSAETEVARWEDSLVSARLQAEKTEESLRRLMNLSPRSGPQDPAIEPTDRPEVDEKDIAYEEALAAALQARPEMAAAARSVEASALEVRGYRNQLLPELNLDFSLWNPGQSGVKYIYENDNPFTGQLIDIIRGSRMDAIRDVFNSWPNSWNIRLSLNVPLADIISRSALARARLQNRQEVLRLENRKLLISFEVNDAIRELGNKKQKTASTRAYRVLLEKRVAAEAERYNFGLVGSEWLFNYQNQLAQARANEIRAAVDYRIARARLEKAMGTLLEARNINIKDRP